MSEPPPQPQPLPPPEPPSLQEMAWAAGKPRAIVDGDDPITQLRDHCTAFIEGAGLSTHHLTMARVKRDEMIFWLRAGYGRG
jgi:hypothetical protein